MDAYRQEILTNALEGRRREVMEYAINIENFQLALQEIENDPSMLEFKQRLEQLLAEHIREHKKANVMLKVLEQQCSVIGQP
jgi:hypothetical protein